MEMSKKCIVRRGKARKIQPDPTGAAKLQEATTPTGAAKLQPASLRETPFESRPIYPQTGLTSIVHNQFHSQGWRGGGVRVWG